MSVNRTSRNASEDCQFSSASASPLSSHSPASQAASEMERAACSFSLRFRRSRITLSMIPKPRTFRRTLR
jgi:hypothetical protein